MKGSWNRYYEDLIFINLSDFCQKIWSQINFVNSNFNQDQFWKLIFQLQNESFTKEMKSLGNGYDWVLIFYVSNEFCLKESLQKEFLQNSDFEMTHI